MWAGYPGDCDRCIWPKGSNLSLPRPENDNDNVIRKTINESETRHRPSSLFCADENHDHEVARVYMNETE